MAIQIRNGNPEAVPLPSPFFGVLKGGQVIILSTPYSVLDQLSPSLSNGFEVKDLGNGYSGANDDAMYGIASIVPVTEIQSTSGDTMIEVDGTSLGFFGADPAAQPATIAALGVAPSLTGSDTISLASLGTELSSLHTKINAISAALKTLGLVAAS